MDKYLLLRNNQKTGPFSAEELKQMGLKSYDLIWVDGKSAAWRYPGEIDALKSFAPKVEEQPYDRFYRKEEPKPEQSASEERYAPKEERKELPERHIFVSVPSAKKAVSPSPTPVQRQFEPVSYISEKAFPEAKERIIHAPVNPVKVAAERNNKPLLLIGTILLVVSVFSVLLYISYRNQRTQLSRLNEIVLNMQQEQQQPIKPAPIHNAVSPMTDLPVQESLRPDSIALQPLVMEKPTAKPVVKAEARKKAVVANAPKDSVLVVSAPKEVVPEPVRRDGGESRQVRRRSAAEQVSVATNEYKTGFLGGISNLKVTVTNNSGSALDKVAVQVEFLNAENKVVKTQSLVFRNLGAGSKDTQDVPRTARGVAVRCRVDHVEGADKLAVQSDDGGKTP